MTISKAYSVGNKPNEFVSVVDYGAVGDGVTDDYSKFISVDAAGSFIVPSGTYLIGTSLALSNDITFHPGAVLKPASGVTITFNGAIKAGGWRIFDTSAGGSITISAPQYADPMWFNAKFDGATDDAAAIQAAFNSASCAILPPGTGVIGSKVSIPASLSINSIGCKLKTASAITMLEASGVDDWSITGALTLEGQGDGSASGTTSAEILLSWSDCRRFVVDNVTCINTGGIGFKGAGAAGGTQRSEGGKLSNVSAYYCQTGWDLDAGTTNEFCSISNGNAGNCYYGARITVGNLSWVGGAIVDCEGNLELTAGANSLHGNMVGVSINHAASWNVKATDVVNGFYLTACNFYGDGGTTGRIELNNSQGIVINGGFWDAPLQMNTGSGTATGKCAINNMVVAGTRAAISGAEISRLDSTGHTPLTTSTPVDGLITTTSYTDATLAGTWATAASRYPASYYKNPETGEVHLRGIVSSGTGTIFTLPSGYRPSFIQEYGVSANGAFGYIIVQTDGQVVHISGSTTKVSLDGIIVTTQL